MSIGYQAESSIGASFLHGARATYWYHDQYKKAFTLHSAHFRLFPARNTTRNGTHPSETRPRPWPRPRPQWHRRRGRGQGGRYGGPLLRLHDMRHHPSVTLEEVPMDLDRRRGKFKVEKPCGNVLAIFRRRGSTVDHFSSPTAWSAGECRLFTE